MAGINNLREIYEKKGKDFLNRLLNNYVIINERIDGAFFGIKKTKEDNFKYFKKSGEISYVDRILMKYYNPAISYFNSMSPEKRNRIPSNFYFGFQYFTRGDAYEQGLKFVPKNNLMLSYIHRLDDSGNILKTVQNKEQLDKWADYLEVERPPIVFEGHLNDEQKSDILEFIYTPIDELLDKFRTKSFTKFILSTVADDSFITGSRDIETIIFRFYDDASENPDEKVFLAKIMDPVFQQRLQDNEAKENKSQDYIWLIILDIMNHIELYDISELTDAASSGSSFDEKYLNLVNKIFKDFIKEYSSKYKGLMLDVPDYLKRPEFALNIDLVNDPQVKSLIAHNETYTEIYKILLNFFRRTRKNSSAGFFTPELLNQLNLVITKIKNIIMGDPVYEGLFPSFKEFIGVSVGSGLISEQETVKRRANKHKVQPVNILIGKFQPVSIGHIKAVQKLNAENGHKTILIAIKSNKQTKYSPFSLKQTKTMLLKVKQEYPNDIADIKIISGGQIEEVVEAIQSDYRPVLWGTSEKRIKDFAVQMDYIKKRKIPLKFMDDFKLIELPTYVTSSELIQDIIDSNFQDFKKKVPKSISSEFFNLRNELKKEEQINESITFKGLSAIGNIVNSEETDKTTKEN